MEAQPTAWTASGLILRNLLTCRRQRGAGHHLSLGGRSADLLEACCPCTPVGAVRCIAACPGCDEDTNFEMLTCLDAAQYLKLLVVTSPRMRTNALLAWLSSTNMPKLCCLCLTA